MNLSYLTPKIAYRVTILTFIVLSISRISFAQNKNTFSIKKKALADKLLTEFQSPPDSAK